MKGPAKLFGMMTVRDEDDILLEVIHHAASLLDVLVIVDCGSVDDSQKIAQEASRQSKNIVVLESPGPRYSEQVRRHIWKRALPALDENCWWMIADADEFADANLRSVVDRANQSQADHIFSEHANFYFTKKEAARWDAGEESLADRSRSITSRRMHYRMHTSQIRLFRHRPWLRWNADTSFPNGLSEAWSERVCFRHYQYRDPEQIKRRLEIRSSWGNEQELMADNPHWLTTEVREKFSDGDKLMVWDGKSALTPDEELSTSWTSAPWKSILKRCRARFQACRQEDEPPQLFERDSLATQVQSILTS